MEDDFENVTMGVAREPEPIMGESVDELELSIRSYNCLKRAGINTVDELCEMTPDDLAKVHNLGRKSYEEILEKLANIGRRLKENKTEIKPVNPSVSSDFTDEVQTTAENIFKEHGLQILKDGERVSQCFRDEMSPSRSRNIITMIFDCGAAETLAAEDANADMLRAGICERLADEYGVSRNISEPIIEKLQRAIENTRTARKNQFGRSICNSLKEMRRQFADANGIEYEEEDCTNPNPCTGTCPYCEQKNKYLLEEAAKLSQQKDIVYPKFKVEKDFEFSFTDEDEDDSDNDIDSPDEHMQMGCAMHPEKHYDCL